VVLRAFRSEVIWKRVDHRSDQLNGRIRADIGDTVVLHRTGIRHIEISVELPAIYLDVIPRSDDDSVSLVVVLANRIAVLTVWMLEQ
jgi:hypothetical protein